MDSTPPLLFLSGFSGGELMVLFLAVLVLFGPKRLPEVIRTIGRTFAQLRKASEDFKDQIMQMDVEPKPEVQDHIPEVKEISQLPAQHAKPEIKEDNLDRAG